MTIIKLMNYIAHMHRRLAIFVSVLSTASACPANAQFLSERVEGLDRICTYTSSAHLTIGGSTTSLRVGIGQNCPHHAPSTSIGLAVPPTAQLSRESVSAAGRSCVYEQLGMTWSVDLPVGRSCPLYAGQIMQTPSDGRPRPIGATINR